MTTEQNNQPPGCVEACKKEILRLIEQCLDGDLSASDEQQLMQKIKDCPDCREILSTHQTYKIFMQMKVERKCCCSELKSQIMQSIDTMR